MRLALVCDPAESARWLDDLRVALPGDTVSLWHDGDAPADAAVVWAPPQRFFDQQPALQAVFTLGAGVDAVLKLQLRVDVPLFRLHDAGMADQMAEYAVALTLGYYRDLDAYVRDQTQQRWQPRPPRRRTDWTVGIAGLGVMGQAVAAMLQPWGFALRGWSRSVRSVPGVQGYAGAERWSAFLCDCDVLINLLPLTDATRGILDGRALGQLRRGAYLINAARGAHVIEADLLAALDSGQLAGATLDVLATEPLPAGHPLWLHPRVRITPHIAARTLRHEAVQQIADGLAMLRRGVSPPGRVDRQLGY